MTSLPLVVAAAWALVAAQVPGLTPEQVGRLERSEPVQVLQATTDSPWPRSTVYQFIEATPEQAAAVLADYELQSSYIPRLNTSRIIGRGDGYTDVEYVVSIPVYPDERSVSRQRVTRSGDEVRIEWQTLVDSTRPGSITRGMAIFKPMVNVRTGRAGTLMIHDQAVVPASVFARVPLVRNRAIAASRDAAVAIARQVEKERAGDHARLEAQVKRLHALIVIK